MYPYTYNSARTLGTSIWPEVWIVPFFGAITNCINNEISTQIRSVFTILPHSPLRERADSSELWYHRVQQFKRESQIQNFLTRTLPECRNDFFELQRQINWMWKLWDARSDMFHTRTQTFLIEINFNSQILITIKKERRKEKSIIGLISLIRTITFPLARYKIFDGYLVCFLLSWK